MPFVAQNKLEEALVQAVKDPQGAGAFLRLLLESELLVLGTVEGQENATDRFSVQPGSKVALVTGEKDGRKFLPVFTSLARMQEYVREESRYLSINGRALLDLTRGAPVILNPASDYGREFTPDEVARLLDGGTRRPMQMIGQKAYPPGMVETLNAVFAEHPAVAAAWMIEVTFADQDGAPHPLVGIEMDAHGDMAALMADIERAAQNALPGLVFDVQRVDRANPRGMTEALLQAPTFYERAAPERVLN